MMDRKGRTIVGLISPKKPFYYLLTHIPGKSGEYQINPQLPKEVLRALGESRRQTIEKEIGRVSEGVIENKKIAERESCWHARQKGRCQTCTPKFLSLSGQLLFFPSS